MSVLLKFPLQVSPQEDMFDRQADPISKSNCLQSLALMRVSNSVELGGHYSAQIVSKTKAIQAVEA